MSGSSARRERPNGGRRAAGTARGVIEVEGAAEHNLADVDVNFGAGLTALVGVSGSGKSSLAFDVVYHEARRRLADSLSLASPWSRLPPARVRSIRGLPPTVALGQDSLIRNPNSSLATASGVGPFLRLLYRRFADRVCPSCGAPIEVLSVEERLRRARSLVVDGDATVVVPLVTGVRGSHARLLAALAARLGVGALEIDGQAWDGQPLDGTVRHTIDVVLAVLARGAQSAEVREALAGADAFGSAAVFLRVDGGDHRLSVAPICPGCGSHAPPPTLHDLRGTDAVAGYRLDGRSFPELLSLPVVEIAPVIAALDLPRTAKRVRSEIMRRLEALIAVGLEYLALDRPSPTLSRGEAQRVRLAILLVNRLDDVAHILDEPTIGLAPAQVRSIMTALGQLPGPVLMVEHDRWAVAGADDVVELGPGAGTEGGRLVFQGTPAELWRAPTPSGRAFPARTRSRRRRVAAESLTIRVATLRNLDGFDCSLPIGGLTVVTGPSGAGKTTLVRDVLVASLTAGIAVGCERVDGPAVRAVLVDQSPIGRNPRSNPATYSGLANPLRDLFARRSGLTPSAFTFNGDGACPACAGMGATELKHRYLPPTWLTCEVCAGRRFRSGTLAVKLELGDGVFRSISDVLDLAVDEAAALFVDEAPLARRLDALAALGLGYLKLGQPSPSLSGGEAQRVKLAKQLAKTGENDLLVVDEPTTGLHPADLDRLLSVMCAVADSGATVVVVEHHPDVVAAADHVIRLGPGGGPSGGRLLHHGSPKAGPRSPRPRARPRAKPRSADTISVRGATANNLRGVSLEIEKGKLTAFAGVSGSGKSSLIRDGIQAEASRRLLECLSLYERQSVKEGPEAEVESLTGLGPTVAIDSSRPRGRRATVGSASELSFQLAVLLAYSGERPCPACGQTAKAALVDTPCGNCGEIVPPLEPRDFLASSYQAACMTCAGIGTISQLREEKLVTHPERALMRGAMYSPGFFPGSYFGKAGNGGYDILRALGQRYDFDPTNTTWRDMSSAAKRAFLFGDRSPLDVEFQTKVRTSVRRIDWRGLFALIEHWDIGGLYTEHTTCPACDGGRLRPEFLAVRLCGQNRQQLHSRPLAEVGQLLSSLPQPAVAHAAQAALKARRRLDFLTRIGLGYLHLDRLCSTLSAGEAQRLKLSALLGGDLTDVTVLLDEPSRGLHPSEVEALAHELVALTAGGNTVVVAEHDAAVLARADDLVVIGPGAGRDGGRVVIQSPAQELARSPQAWALGRPPAQHRRGRRVARGWLEIRGARENNLAGEDIALPLGVLAGVCGISGSGKSTLVADTLGLALAPTKLTSSVAYEQVYPGAHEAIVGAPPRTIVVDQAAARVTSPGVFLGVSAALRRAFAASDAAVAAGLEDKDLAPSCDRCHGRGFVREDMGFLPAISYACEACDGSGHAAEARELLVRGRNLPETEALEIGELLELWADVESVARPLRLAVDVGLGYLVVRQSAATLSGGERQRLKLVKELAKGRRPETLFILDEPTVGQQQRDVGRLVSLLDRLVDAGHSVLVVDHHPTLLAACDWLLELGPGGGPAGGRVVASGTPEDLARGATATAPYLREVLA